MALALLTGCLDCDHQIAQRVPSPDGKRDAVVFSSFCGFNSSANTAVSVLRSGEDPPGRGRPPFVVFYGDRTGQRGPWGGPAVNARWITADTLLITYRASAEIVRFDASRAGVTLVYEVKADERQDSTATAGNP